MKLADILRFEAKVDFDGPGGCWLWTAGKDWDGYGVFWLDGTTTRAHRVAYQWSVGPIPDGKQLDHVRERGCLHTSCVNPAHLEPVTCKENLDRSEITLNTRNVRKTHCPQGHPYDEANTLIVKGGRRACRECRLRAGREQALKYRLRNPEKVKAAQKRYQQENRERWRAYQNAYRARKKAEADASS